MLGVSAGENQRAIAEGFRALEAFQASMRAQARAEIDRLEREGRIGIVLLGRPYHADEGINHAILAEFQKRHYPIFTPSSLPVDDDILERLFGDEVRAGVIRDPREITDVWKNAYSANSNSKLWAAKFAARHPNLIAMEIGSFRCGHDAMISSAIEGIIESSGTPFFSFRDLDENKPAGIDQDPGGDDRLLFEAVSGGAGEGGGNANRLAGRRSREPNACDSWGGTRTHDPGIMSAVL